MASLRDKVVAEAEKRLGVPYNSMDDGKKGYGCAMLVCACLNAVLGTRYYGSCWSLWGDAIGAPQYNEGGGEFEVISAKDALPGDVVMYFKPDVNIGYSTNASHAALYVGDGKVIGAYGYGTIGTSYYMPGGSVRRTTVAYQSLGGSIQYIRCKRLKGDVPTPTPTPTTEVFPVNKTVTVRSATLNVRDAPSTKTGAIKAQYRKGETVVIDGVAFGDDGYMWGHYIGASSGKDRYIALGSMELAR